MKLSLESITKDADAWTAKGVALPKFDIAAMRAQTKETPEWVHFGAGNIFRMFVAGLQQRLLDAGEQKAGIIAVETFDAFTDIEFNPERSLNCQARSAALYRSLVHAGKLEEALSSQEAFLRIHPA